MSNAPRQTKRISALALMSTSTVFIVVFPFLPEM